MVGGWSYLKRQYQHHKYLQMDSDLIMAETIKRFAYGENVKTIDGACQEDCSIEECN